MTPLRSSGPADVPVRVRTSPASNRKREHRGKRGLWVLAAAAVLFYVAAHAAIVDSVWPVHGTAVRARAWLLVDALALVAWAAMVATLWRTRYRGGWGIVLLPLALFFLARPSVFHAFSDPSYVPDGGLTHETAFSYKVQHTLKTAAERDYDSTRLAVMAAGDEVSLEDVAPTRPWSLHPSRAGALMPVLAPLALLLGVAGGRRRRFLQLLRDARWFLLLVSSGLVLTLSVGFTTSTRVAGTTPWELFLPLFVIGWGAMLADDSYNIGGVGVLRARTLLKLFAFGALPVSLFVLLPGTRDLGTAVVLAASLGAMLVVGTRQRWWAVLMGVTWIVLIAAAFQLDERSATRLRLAYEPYHELAEGGPTAKWGANLYQIKLFDANVAAGGILGAGTGRGHGELAPNAADDGFITLFAADYGWAGGVALVLLYTAFLLQLLGAASHERGAFERTVIIGFATLLAMPFWLSILGSIRVIPLTGVAAGFLAHGGSKLLASSLTVGLIAGIASANAIDRRPTHGRSA